MKPGAPASSADDWNQRLALSDISLLEVMPKGRYW